MTPKSRNISLIIISLELMRWDEAEAVKHFRSCILRYINYSYGADRFGSDCKQIYLSDPDYDCKLSPRYSFHKR